MEDYTMDNMDMPSAMDDMGAYQATDMQVDVDPAAMAAVAGFGMVAFVIWFAIIVLVIVSMWKIFVKAGQPGWASIIPIYNCYVMLQIAGKPGWWLLLFFVPFVNIVIAIMMWHGVSRAFGKDIGFTLGLIFLGIIFLPILAFGSATYRGVHTDASIPQPTA